MSAATAIPSQAPPPAPAPLTLDDSRVQEYETKLQGLSAEVTRLAGELKASQEGQKAMAEELEKIRKDQDDLLELLADQVCGYLVFLFVCIIVLCYLVEVAHI